MTLVMEETWLAPLADLVRRHFGLDFPPARWPDLLRGLRERVVGFVRSREDLDQAEREEQAQRERDHQLDERESSCLPGAGVQAGHAHFRSAIRTVVLTTRRRVSAP